MNLGNKEKKSKKALERGWGMGGGWGGMGVSNWHEDLFPIFFKFRGQEL